MNIPRKIIRPFTKRVSKFIFTIGGTKKYWETRYSLGMNSGSGSYGRLAVFKANTINSLIEEFQINSIIELGCGDGNQTSFLNENVKYLGLDISPTVITRNLKKFKTNTNKDFMLFDSDMYKNISVFLKGEMTISLDVLYHLIEQEVYENYLKTLFGMAKNYVIIYACDNEHIKTDDAHIRIRAFTPYIAQRFKDFRLIRKIDNEFHSADYEKSSSNNYSWCDFFVYERVFENAK